MPGETQITIPLIEDNRTKQRKASEGSRVTNPGRVLQILQDRIVTRTYKPGGWLPTERELAQELGVNRSAVRDALLHLEHSALIERRPGCRPRVLGVPHTPSDQASHSRTASRAIAVVLPQHQADHASREIVRGIGKVLRSGDMPYRQLTFDVIMQARESHIMEQEACEALRAGEAAAAIVWPTLHPDALAQWRTLQEQGYPVVFVDRYDQDMACDFVGVDNYSSAREAVDYLLDLGHTRIAYITTSEAASVIRERAAGYRDAMEEAGWLTPKFQWTVRQGHMVESAEVIRKGIEEDGLPTAVFAVNDHSAYRCIDYLWSRGIRVPEDVSVIGFDDIDRFSPRPGHLTSVRQPFERIGQRAAEIALKRLSSTTSAMEPYQQILLSTRLIERESCRSIKYT